MRLFVNKCDSGIPVSLDDFEHICLSCRKLVHFDISGMLPPEWVSAQCSAIGDSQRPAFCLMFALSEEERKKRDADVDLLAGDSGYRFVPDCKR